MQKILELPAVRLLNKQFGDLKMSDFEIIKTLGRGSFGKVEKVLHRLENRFFALKSLNKRKIGKQKIWGQLQKEIEILAFCDHENIIKLFAVFGDEEFCYLVLELANGKSLFEYLKERQKLREHEICLLVRDIVSGLIYLHRQRPPILHRDLKPENIVFHNNSLKLADFGWSSHKDDFRNTFCGTPDYLSPEMILGTGHDSKLDVWSVGILIYELLHGKPPFAPDRKFTDRRLYLKCIEQRIIKGRVDFLPDVSRESRATIQALLEPSPKDRPDALQILSLPLFAKFLVDPMETGVGEQGALGVRELGRVYEENRRLRMTVKR